MTASPLIDRIIKRALEEENHVLEQWTGFTKARLVFFMEKKMSDAIRNEFQKVKGLSYFKKDAFDTHYPPDEGFKDDFREVVISFPLSSNYTWVKL